MVNELSAQSIYMIYINVGFELLTSAEGHSSRYSENLSLFFRNTVSANQWRMVGLSIRNGCRASYHSEAGPLEDTVHSAHVNANTHINSNPTDGL